MAKAYRKTARRRRRNRKHGGVPQLAAEICGRSVKTIYGVIYGNVKSEPVARAIEEARRRLGEARGEAA